MKRSKFLITLYLLTLFFIMAGSTFAYFSTSIRGEENVSLNAYYVNVSLNILPLYKDKVIIPLNDSDVFKAYDSECTDDLGNGACYAYTMTIENTGTTQEYDGDINFNLNGITNLKYIVLDEDDNEYTDMISIVSNTEQTLGDSFTLNDGESKTFKLIIWLSNLDAPQENDDADGTFSASVTYATTAGSGRVTGTFSA